MAAASQSCKSQVPVHSEGLQFETSMKLADDTYTFTKILELNKSVKDFIHSFTNKHLLCAKASHDAREASINRDQVLLKGSQFSM